MFKKILLALGIATTAIAAATTVQGGSNTSTSDTLLAQPCRAFDSAVGFRPGQAHTISVRNCIGSVPGLVGVKVNVTGTSANGSMWVQAGDRVSYGSSSILNLTPGFTNSNGVEIAATNGDFQIAAGPGHRSARIVIDVLGYSTGK